MSEKPTNTYSREHPGHAEPDRYLDDEGRCTFCGRALRERETADLQAQVRTLTEEPKPVCSSNVHCLCVYAASSRVDSAAHWMAGIKRERDEANRQLVAVVGALVRTGKWARLPDGYLMCMVCCTGMRCECEPGEHVPRESCPNCLGRSGSILADITAGERVEKLEEALGRLEWDRWLIAMLVATEYTQHAEGCPRDWDKECECWIAQVFTAAEARAALREEGK